MNVYGVRSKNKFFGATAAGEQHDVPDQTRVGVMAWFVDLLLSADKMPDSADYMLPAPHKKTVYQWYMTDHGERPTVYPMVCSSYFLRVWREEFPRQAPQVPPLLQVLLLRSPPRCSVGQEDFEEAEETAMARFVSITGGSGRRGPTLGSSRT